MKSLIKKLTPKFLIKIYHFLLAKLAAFIYGYPSRKMIIVGITGTGGKSSTVYLLAKLLEKAGHKVGATSTVFFKVADWEKINDKKMTMLGRFQTQKLLRQMVKAGCQIAIIETTSQGIEQYRHLDIDYDVVALTNLYPEHIEAHGGFENYKKAKGKLFAALSKTPPAGGSKKEFKIPKTIIVNGDDEFAQYFLSFNAEKKIIFGMNNKQYPGASEIIAKNLNISGNGIEFDIENNNFSINLLGKFNAYNALCAIAIAKGVGLDWEKIKNASVAMINIPGRLEFINEGQDFKVIVDYAFEPKAMAGLYETVKMVPHNKIIHVLGSAGGGRDTARRPELGKIAAQNADYVIVTNEDPYDEDPAQIINQVAEGALKAGKLINVDLFAILDRHEAIKKAISLAKKNDLVLITGKGSEQAICVSNEKKIPWDDRDVVREVLRNR